MGRAACAQRDSKAKQLIEWLKDHLKPGGKWSNERVIIFTEYRATQNWLQEVLATEGFSGGDRLMTMYGGMDSEQREAVKAAFQTDHRKQSRSHPAGDRRRLRRPRLPKLLLPADPLRDPVESEPHGAAERRVDRHGQKADKVLVYHFVGKGYKERANQQFSGHVATWKPTLSS